MLVFDQFEEVLRLEKDKSDQALGIILNSLQKVGVNVVISLRTEYEHKLNPLERYTGGLYNRKYTVEPISYKTCKDEIVNYFEYNSGLQLSSSTDDPSKSSNLEVLDYILWSCTKRANLASSKLIDSNSPNQPPFCKLDDNDHIDLISLQSVMYDIWTRKDNTKDTPTPQLCQAFYKHYNRIFPSNVEFDDFEIIPENLSELPAIAMQEWVNTKLSDNIHLTEICSKIKDGAELNSLPSETTISAIIKMLSARMSLYVSSGGYKVPCNIIDLKAKLLRNEFAVLCRSDQRTIQEEYLKSKGRIDDFIKIEKLGIPETYTDSRPDIALSGLSIEHTLSSRIILKILDKLADDAIELLIKACVLREVNESNKRVIELVHDKMGAPFAKWGENLEQSWENAVYSLTSSCGVNINYTKADFIEKGEVKYVRWIGCFIQSQSDKIQTVLEDITFTNSLFSGTVFFNCTFKNVIFKECNLDGIIFMNCIIGSKEASETESICGIKIENCDGNGWSILNTGTHSKISDTEADGDEQTKKTRGPHIHSLKIINSSFEHFRCIGIAISDRFSIINTHLKHFEVKYQPGILDKNLKSGVFEIKIDEKEVLKHSEIEKQKLKSITSIMEYCTWDKRISKIIDIDKGVTLIGCGTSIEYKY